MPPEALSCGKLSERGDVWTLGMLLLLCMSLEFDLDSAQCGLKSVLDIFQQVKGASLLSLASNKAEKSVNETHNESDVGDNFSCSSGKRT